MKVYLFIISIFLITFFPIACSDRTNRRCSIDRQQNVSYMETSKILDTLSSKYPEGVIEFPFTLFENRKFSEIINDPCAYKSSLISALKDKDKPRAYKIIALYCLQHLCIDDYLEVLNVVFDGYNKKNFDEAFLMSSLSQDGFSLEVSKSYSMDELQSLLKAVVPTLKNEDHRSYLLEVISGKNWVDRRNYI